MSDGGSRRRVHALDLLRVIASVQMISGHTIGALLAPEHASGTAFTVWSAFRGLTAVAFMFAAGAAFAQVAPGSPPERVRGRVVRALTLIALGYALHPPVGALDADAAVAAASWRDFFAVDVLSCIGVTLLALEALVRWPRFAITTGLCAVAMIGLAPWASTIEPAGALLPFASFLSRRAGSLFPLLPFAGFVFAGASIGSFAFHDVRAVRPIALVGAAVSLAGAALWLTTSPPEDAYYAWPALSLARLGAVLLGTAVLAYASRELERLPAPITTLAAKSLFLYVSHLLVLYGGGVGLVALVGPTLTPLAAISASVAMVIACTLAALAWARVREPRAVTRRR